ncbi:MAG: poly(3-hydroxybutyrate) depolymerase [Actinomycetia bacterium]|nr:poly(3-hydroxybutyrate) depolymerase [Actinomycetes bacterium]
MLVLATSACSSSSAKASGATAPTTTPPTTGPTPPSSAVPPKASPGCTAAGSQPGDQKVTIQSGGTARYYLQHVPPGGSAKPTPLVVDIHGYAEGAEIQVKMSALGAYGDTHHFVTIEPQGTGPVPHWDTGLQSADMKFIGDALDNVEKTLCIDTARVFVTGLSNGAMMTSAVACAYSDRVAAVAPVAGVWKIGGCAPSRPVPVVAFHGTKDPFLAYTGGLGPAVANLPAPDGSGKKLGGATTGSGGGPSVPQVMADWARRNGCKTKPAALHVTNDVTMLKFPCPSGADVSLYRVTNGGHAWPGSTFSKAVEKVIGPTTMSIDADAIMWKFFAAHPL